MDRLVHKVFHAGSLTWVSYANGKPSGSGSTTGNIDTSTIKTDQIRAESFIVGDLPSGATDDKWDEVTIRVNYTHVNTVTDGDSDIGKIHFRLTNGKGDQVSEEFQILIQPEDGPTGTFSGEATISFKNVAPGKYWLFAGENDTGDAEALFVSAADVIGTEAVPCFTRGTLILTAKGPRPIEELSKGELILTRDNGFQPIRWIGSNPLTPAELAACPRLRPIRIRAGAIGRDLPSSDLLVSPQHRLLVRSKIAQRMFGTQEVLVAAKQLLEIDGIEIAEDVEEVEYFHLLFDRHEIILSNGAETESLYTGEQALKAIGIAGREEIFTLFPELRDGAPAAIRPPARLLLPGRPGRKLAWRHSKNSCELVAEAAGSLTRQGACRPDPRFPAPSAPPQADRLQS